MQAAESKVADQTWGTGKEAERAAFREGDQSGKGAGLICGTPAKKNK